MLVKSKVILEQVYKFLVLINGYGLSASYFYEIKVDGKNLKLDFKSSSTIANHVLLSLRYMFHWLSKVFSKDCSSSCFRLAL